MKERRYGGILRNTRKGRQGPRPLSPEDTMHLVLRSSQARGKWSFLRHQKKIKSIVEKFSKKYSVKIHSMANVGNHLHFHLFVKRRKDYCAFIRALTSSITMAVTGASRWNPLEKRFWDQRPFTRIIWGFRDYINVKDYIAINQLEGKGYSRIQARRIVWRADDG